MAASFLHGIEVIEVTSGPLPVTVVVSAVVGLVGRAPQWAQSGAIPLWNPNTIYAVGAYAIDGNGNLQRATAITSTGASGTTAPTWSTSVGASTADSDVTWKLIAPAGSSAMAAIPGAPLVNFPTLVSSQAGAAQFGPLVQGYDIPYALNAIQLQGAGQVIVVNVFDQTKHVTSLTAQSFSFPSSGAPQVLNLGHMGVSGVVVTNSVGSTTYVNGTDFTVDYINGVVTQTSGTSMTAGEAVKLTFSYADPTKNADADIVGTVSDGVYTGIQALQTTFNTMGFFAKLLIAPNWSKDATVASALDAMAQTIRAIALVDSVPATQVATAISNRGASGNPFNTSSVRTVLCFPNLLFTDLGLVPTGVTISPQGVPIQNAANATSETPFSQWIAGCQAAKDLNYGYWYSVSNTQITGVLGPDVTIYASAFDPNSDTNNLNAAGIVTVFNAFATGYRVWGNRSSAFPTYTAPDNFVCIRRTMDIIEQSLMQATLQFLDGPISNALISAILQMANNFILTLVARGALVPGSAVTFDPGNNPAAQMAAGQLVFSIDCMPPPPAERITYDTTIDITLLSNLSANPIQTS